MVFTRCGVCDPPFCGPWPGKGEGLKALQWVLMAAHIFWDNVRARPGQPPNFARFCPILASGTIWRPGPIHCQRPQ
jgi:hypothetical protein